MLRSEPDSLGRLRVGVHGHDQWLRREQDPHPRLQRPDERSRPGLLDALERAARGSPYLLDTLDARFEAAVAAVDPGHGIALWTAHAVFGGPGAEERWYEIDPTTGSLLQSNTVTSSSLFVWNGAVSPDRANSGSTAAFGDSMAMSVSTSSTSSYPAIQLVWKKQAVRNHRSRTSSRRAARAST
jgi:hypothetical protein